MNQIWLFHIRHFETLYLHCIMLYCGTLYYHALYRIELYCTVLFYIELCCIVVFNLKTHLDSFCSPFCYQVWSHADYPLIEIGRMTLDRNPTNYFAEIEQLAFAPSHMIPGKS